MGREEERGGRRRRLEKEARPGRCGEGLAAACASGWAGPRAVERRDEARPAWLERGQRRRAGCRPGVAAPRRPPRARRAERPTAGPSWTRRARPGRSGNPGALGAPGPDAPPLGSACRSRARAALAPPPPPARPGPRSAVEEPLEEPGACAPRPPDMVGHLHLQGMEESLKEKSREGVLDSPDSGLPPSPSPSPPFYSLAPGILDARAGGAGASSEAPGPGEARAVSTHLRAERGGSARPPHPPRRRGTSGAGPGFIPASPQPRSCPK